MSECNKKLIIEQYEGEEGDLWFHVLNGKNCDEDCGLTLNQMLVFVEEQMRGKSK